MTRGRGMITMAIACAWVAGTIAGQQPPAASPVLLNPAALTETAPATFVAQFDTTAGPFTVRVTRAWAPVGADRFYNLVKAGFYNDCRIFRVVPGYVVQFGINGDPEVTKAWAAATMASDRARMSNTRGRLTFAMGAIATTRSTQVFVNLGDNSKKLDQDGYAPFGEVATGLAVMDGVFAQYGEAPDQKQIATGGNAYLARLFPKLDYIRTATITSRGPSQKSAGRRSWRPIR